MSFFMCRPARHMWTVSDATRKAATIPRTPSQKRLVPRLGEQQAGPDAQRNRGGNAPVDGRNQLASAGLAKVGEADGHDEKRLEPFAEGNDERLQHDVSGCRAHLRVRRLAQHSNRSPTSQVAFRAGYSQRHEIADFGRPGRGCAGVPGTWGASHPRVPATPGGSRPRPSSRSLRRRSSSCRPPCATALSRRPAWSRPTSRASRPTTAGARG